MCQQIIQFCAGSTKPLIFAGSFLLVLTAIGLGYTSCSANALYQDIDTQRAQEKALSHYLQLAASLYLVLVTLLASVAAFYDQKQSIRALSLITSVNFVLAVVAISMVPSATEIVGSYGEQLQKAQGLYDYTDKPAATIINQTSSSADATAAAGTGQQQPPQPHKRNIQAAEPKVADAQVVAGGANTSRPFKLDKAGATRIWDSLQAHGCCGLKNATTEWKDGIPKSCCANADLSNDSNKYTCKNPDLDHSRPCAEIIGSTGMNLLVVLALIALVNLYLATVSGISTYRTFHYNEASQNAYA